MKPYNYFKNTLLFIALIFSFQSLTSINAKGQSCDQLEILYTEPDCFRPKGITPAGSNGDGGCKAVSACVNQPYDYLSSLTGLGYTYNWVVTGPASVTFLPNSNAPQVKIVWPIIGEYTLTLTVTDNLGNVFTKCLTVGVKEKPNASFTFAPNNQCAGSVIQFTNGSTFSGGMLYSWDFNDPSSNTNYSSALSPTHQFDNPGTYNVTLIVSSFALVLVTGTQGHQEEYVQKVCCSDTITQRVTIVPGTMKIDCITTMCANTTATYTAVGCAIPTWSLPIGGTLINTVGNQITVQWGTGAIQGQLSASCGAGTCTTTVQIPIIPAVPVAIGNLSPCLNATESYSLPVLPGTFYTWRLFKQPGNVNVSSNIYTFPDNNTAWINWTTVTGGVYTPGETYQLFVKLENLHNCCGPFTNFITITPKETFSVYSNQEVCLGGTATLSTFPTYGTFNWSVLPITGVSPLVGTGTVFNPTFSTSGNYVVSVNELANSYCNSSGPQTVKVTVLPATPAPGIIIGPVSVCLSDILPYSMSTAAPLGYHYTWAITAGTGTFEPGAMTTTTGDGVNILWSTVPGQISVVLERNSFPYCPSIAVIKNVIQATTGSVTGNANVCVDADGSYTLAGGTVPAGTSVIWSVIPAGLGTIISGQGTTNVIIKWHAGVGGGTWAASVNATTTCGVALPFNVTIYPKFTFTITQSSNICQPLGAILTASTPAYSPSYLWSNSSIANPTAVFSSGIYSLTVTNAGGCTATNTIEVIDPFIITSSCSVGVCTGLGMQEVLTVGATAPGAITYQWFTGTSPSGSPIGAANTNTYTATVGGNYYVEVYYGTCTKIMQYNIEQVCCPDLNIPSISATQTSCFDFAFKVGSLVAGKPYTLFFGDGTSVSGTTTGGSFGINHTYSTAGVYCVKLRIENGACGVNWAVTSAVVPIKAQFFYKLACTGCVTITNLSINLSSPSFVTYDWDFGDGFISLGNPTPTPPAHCYTIPGNYILKLTVNFNNGAFACSNVYVSPITYTPLTIGVVPSPVCTDNLVSFNTINGSAQLVSYNWAFGDGNFAYSASSTHTYSVASPPNYNVTLLVMDIFNNSCNVSASVNVLPGFTATLAPGYICPGGSAVLSPTITGPVGTYTYLWEELIGVNWVAAMGANTGPTYTTASPSTFHCIITAPNGCKTTTNLVPVINVPKPVAKISVSQSKKLCTPGALVILNSDNHLAGYTSQWYVGSIAPANELSGSPSQNLSVFVGVSDNYYLVLTNQYGCQDICQILIEVNNPPSVPVISPLGPVCDGIPTVLAIPATSNNILWNTGQSTNSITVYTAGVYAVTVTDPATGCSSTAQKLVNRRPIVDLFPHFCQKVTCDCIVPFSIYGPQPLVGSFAPSPPYQIDWYSWPANTLIAANQQNLTSVATGSYYIVMTDPATGCKNKSETYSVTVPTVEECDQCSCDLSSWGTVALTTTNPISTIIIPCPTDSPISIGCINPYVLSGTYNCSAKGCVSVIKYSITPPSGPIVTGTLPYTFTPISGSYTVTLTAYCDGKACNVCTFKINACPPLEVSLINFKAQKTGQKIEIEWNTSAEINNEYYNLERSKDGNLFEKIAKIKSQNSNTKEVQNYSFIDLFPINGINYYRLKAVELNEKATYSHIIAIDFEQYGEAKVYPNPTKSNIITVSIPIHSETKIGLEFIDILGRILKAEKYNATKGMNKYQIDVSKIPVGKYIIRIVAKNESKVLPFEKLE